MLQKLFGIIKGTPVRMVLQPMEHLIMILNYVNLDIASYISLELKAWIQDRLDNGLTTRQIYQEHKKIWYMHDFLEMKLV
jgi:hypothetical protein